MGEAVKKSFMRVLVKSTVGRLLNTLAQRLLISPPPKILMACEFENWLNATLTKSVMSSFVRDKTTIKSPKTKRIMPKGAFFMILTAFLRDLIHTVTSKNKAKIRAFKLKGSFIFEEMKKLATKSIKNTR